MTPRQLDYFLATVDFGGVSQAAEQLHVAQPAVSHGIKQLERELGIQLFDRVQSRLVLTADGKALVGPTREALRQLALIRQLAQEAKTGSTSAVRLVALPSLNLDPVPKICAAFRGAHPGSSVSVELAFTASDCFEIVARGDADVALALADPGHDYAASNLQTHRVGSMEMLLMAPPGHVPTHDGPVEREALDGLAFVAGRPGTWTREYLDALEVDGIVPKIAVEARSRDLVVPLVVSGVGFAVVAPQFAALGRAAGAVIQRIEPAPVVDVVMITSRGQQSPSVDALAAMIADLRLDPLSP